MDELGRDFFLRAKLRSRCVVWFQCPATNQLKHSAAKSNNRGSGAMPGVRSTPGERYCHLCNRCFSANNFSSQHLQNRHRAGAPCSVTPTLIEASPTKVMLKWTPPLDGETRLRITGSLSVAYVQPKCSTV